MAKRSLAEGCVVLMSGFALAGSAMDASATDAEPGAQEQGAQEIVVTAQRREQSLRDVPIAVSALSADDLASHGISEGTDLDLLVPNTRAHSFAGGLSIYIRGIGTSQLATGSDSGTAFHENGVYIARSRAQVAALFDVERVEVLRGPQGTLYGRNATGGVVNVITKAPTDSLSVDARLRYGNHDTVEAEAAISGPVFGDSVRARLSGLVRQHDGFGRNIATGTEIDDRDEKAVRLSADFRLAPSATLSVLGEHYQRDDRSGGFHLFGPAKPGVPLAAVANFGGTVASNVRDLSSEVDPIFDMETSGVSVTLDVDLTDAVTLKAISAYRDYDALRITDIDHTEVPFAALTLREKGDQISQEVQVTWTGARLTGVVGAFYLEEDLDLRTVMPLELLIPVPGARFRQDGTGTVEAAGLFGNLDFRLTDRLTLSGGLRYSYEERSHHSISGAGVTFVDTIAKDDWSSVTPKVSLQYEFSDDAMAYVSAGKGFKSGAFGIGTPNPAINPEYVWAYEVGAKLAFLDRRLQTNLAAFYYDYTDLQVNKVVGAVVTIENAATAEIKGLEIEVAAQPWKGMTLQLNAGYLDATFTEYLTGDPVFPELGTVDLSGNRLPLAPEYTLSLTAVQQVSLGSLGTLTLLGGMTATDDVYFTSYNHRIVSEEDSVDLRARIGFTPNRGNWSLALWGENLGDETLRAGGDVSANFLGFPARGVMREPRRYGLEFQYNF